jgi:predicted transposase/invertase (TIGR01784 family)
MIELLDIKVDVVFKDFFGDKSNKEILEKFINAVLDLHGDDLIEVEEFLDPRKMRVEIGRASTFADLSVKTRGGKRYIIEMQTYNHERFDKRLLYYLGKDYTEQIDYHYHQSKH